MLGGFVRKIQIGSGNLLGSFRIMGTRCDIHESLRSGAVWHSLTSAKNARIKLAAITVAGPVASILLVGVFMAILMLIQPFTENQNSFCFYAYPFLIGCTLPSIAFLPGILIPYRYQFAGRTMQTDALRLLTLPKLSGESIAAMVESAQLALTLREEMDLGTASLEEALARADMSPNDPLTLNTAISFLRAAQDPRSIAYYKKLINLGLPASKRTVFVDQYVTYCLESNEVISNREEMDALSLELMATDPKNISVMGTRGSILIDLGRIGEGKAMLRTVLTKAENTIDKSYSNIFLALAEKQQGNPDLAREYAEAARTADPANPALKRIADLLPPVVETETTAS